jgi:hypothetical protein
MKTLGRRGLLAAGAALAASPLAHAQGYPDRAIRFIGGFPPGGPADLSGRMLAQSLGEILGQQVVVENKSGAAGNIASQFVADSRPDGYTLLIGTSIMSIVPSIYDKLPYDPYKSFVAVAHFTTIPMVIVVPADGPRTLQELIALLKKEPGKSYGTPGNGSLIHMGSLLFSQHRRGDAARALSRLRAGHAGHAGRPSCLPDRHARQQQGVRRRRPPAHPRGLRERTHGGPGGRADRAGDHRLPVRGRDLVPDLRAGRHASGDRRQAERQHQSGDQVAGHRRQGQGARHGDGAVDTGLVAEAPIVKASGAKVE